MTNFHNLRLVALDGVEAPYDHSDRNSPYHPDWYDSEIAKRVTQSRLRGIRWEFKGKTKERLNTFKGGIALDAKSDLLVIKTGKVMAINPDGTVNHEIIIPKFVEIEGEELPLKHYPVEEVAEVLEKNGRIVIGMYYRYDMIERRYYDPSTHEWQERDQIYRL